MLNGKGLVALIEHQQVSWRLIKVETGKQKLQETYTAETDFTF